MTSNISESNQVPAIGLVVIGMSAGGLSALRDIVRALPFPFPGAIIVAQHVKEPSLLPELLSNWCPHEVVLAASGDTLREGVVFVCPAQRHVVVNADATLTISGKQHIRFVRPSIDWLFETAAATYRERAVAVVLSGSNSDGSRGALCIADAGGLLIVQEPRTCERPEMPRFTMASGRVQLCLEPEQIARAFTERISRANLEYAHAWNNPFGATQPTVPEQLSATAAE